MERPVEYRFTDVRGSARQQARTVNISSTGVLLRTDQRIGVGRKLEVIVRMAKLAPDSPEIDLRLLGMTVRAGDGWVAVEARKHQILSRAPAPTGSLCIPPGNGNTPGRLADPAA